jgi:DNA-binding beta-propeller fold protein YncE
MFTKGVNTILLPCSILALSCALAAQCISNEITKREKSSAQQPAQQFAQQSAGPATTVTSNSSIQSTPDATALWKKVQRTLLRDGIALQLEVGPIEPQSASSAANTGTALRVRLSVHDSSTHAPLTGLHPSVWMSLNTDETVPCTARARAFLRRSLLEKQPELDLNDYHVLVLNQDATIHVVDPQFSSGRSRLLASIPLPGRADDWLLSADQSKLFVSISQSGELLMIDTATWTIIHRVKISGVQKLAIQPDEHYIWASYFGSESGIAVLSAADLHPVKQIPLHTGRHDIAITNNSRVAFVTDPGAASVSIFDVTQLTRTHEVKTPGPASSIAYSAASQFAYVTTTSGSIVAINDRGEIVGRIQAEPGLARIAFFRDGRFGFVLNPEKGLLHVIDAARNALVQTAPINAAPEQIAFSDQLAYVVRRDSDLIEMVPLDALGAPGAAVSTVDLPAAHNAFKHATADELTTTMVQAPGENAVVIANAADKAVFYYEEGMAAPMGTFSNFGKSPRSVLVVDRSLKEKSPGVYEAAGRLEKPGTYIVPVLLDTPRIVECFTLPIGVADPTPAASPAPH